MGRVISFLVSKFTIFFLRHGKVQSFLKLSWLNFFLFARNLFSIRICTGAIQASTRRAEKIRVVQALHVALFVWAAAFENKL
jgi:hypothetical protein